MSTDPKLPPELEDTEVEDLKQMINAWRNIQGWCRVTRWLVIGGFIVVVSVAQFGDAVKSIFGWKH